MGPFNSNENPPTIECFSTFSSSLMTICVVTLYPDYEKLRGKALLKLLYKLRNLEFLENYYKREIVWDHQRITSIHQVNNFDPLVAILNLQTMKIEIKKSLNSLFC